MSHNFQQFGVKLQEHGTSELDSSKDSDQKRYDDSASPSNRTPYDNTYEDSSSIINTSPDDFIDDMLYGLADDDFEDDDEDSDNINPDYDEDDDDV
jgi:hypothetical protein